MSHVYVVRYSLCCGTELVSCYASLQGAINRVKMMEVTDSLCEDESVTITKEEIISNGESNLRLSRAQSYSNNSDA